MSSGTLTGAKAARLEPTPRKRRRTGRGKQTGWMFVAPFMVVLILMLIVPIGYAIYQIGRAHV